MKGERIKIKDVWKLHLRALLLWERWSPGLLATIALGVLFRAATPYVNIYFSARILNELAGARRGDLVWRLILLTLVINGLLGALGAYLERRRMAIESSVLPYIQHGRILREKMIHMDFPVFEAQRTKELYTKIVQEYNWGGWGLPKLLPIFEQGMEALVRVLCAVILVAEFFGKKVPIGNGFWTLLDHPVIAGGIFVLLLAMTWLAPFFQNKAESYWAGYAQNATLGNRLYSFFGYEVISRERALDMRLYEQFPLCKFYLQKDNDFGPGSPIAEYAKGPMGRFHALGAAISVVFTGLAYVFVCLKAWAGAYGVGSVTRYIGSITALSQGLSGLLATYGQMQANGAYLKQTFTFLDIPNEMYQGSLTTEKRRDNCYEVEFRDVSFRYPDADDWALRHVNLKFQVGKRLAVVGENGSGKTTFIKLLCRLYDPTEGEILLNGIDIRKYQYDDYRSLYATVFQDFTLLAFPLGENVAAGSDYDRKRAEDCLIRAGFGERLKTLPEGLDTYLYRDFEEKGVQVSGGEAQKIALARALYKDSPFVILDEPTAALDPVAEYELYTRFNEVVRDKTTVYISHRLASCRFCDDILVFDRGSVVQQGSHDRLMAQEGGKYSVLWEAQAQYYQKN